MNAIMIKRMNQFLSQRLRPQHSYNLLIASLLNRLLVKVAFLTAPTGLAHEQYLQSEFERALARIKEIGARTK